MEILAAGGEFSIPYTLTESYDDGVLSADCEADWISFLSCGESEVTFVAEANEELEPRSATVVLCYTYGEERDTVTARVSAVQAAADEPESEYDFEFNATDFSGTYFGNIYGQNGEYCFDAYLMDKPMDGDYFAAGTTAYLFDMFTTAPGDSKNPRPAPGTYMLGELYATASMTFTPDLSCRMYQNEDGTVTRTRFSDGTLTISEEGGNVIFEAFLTDENGKTHHVTYSGPTNYVSDGVVSGGGLDVLEDDLDIQAGIADASAGRGFLAVSRGYSGGDGRTGHAFRNVCGLYGDGQPVVHRPADRYHILRRL